MHQHPHLRSKTLYKAWGHQHSFALNVKCAIKQFSPARHMHKWHASRKERPLWHTIWGLFWETCTNMKVFPYRLVLPSPQIWDIKGLACLDHSKACSSQWRWMAVITGSIWKHGTPLWLLWSSFHVGQPLKCPTMGAVPIRLALGAVTQDCSNVLLYLMMVAVLEVLMALGGNLRYYYYRCIKSPSIQT